VQSGAVEFRGCAAAGLGGFERCACGVGGFLGVLSGLCCGGDGFAVCVDVALRGLSMIGTDTLTHTGPLFDGLAEFYRRATLLGREPA